MEKALNNYLQVPTPAETINSSLLRVNKQLQNTEASYSNFTRKNIRESVKFV